MALSTGLKLSIKRIKAKIAAVVETGLATWHKMTANTWTGANRLPDSSTNSNSAALYTGRGLSFDGVNDVVTVGDTGQTVRTVVFYAYPDTTTTAFMQLQSSGAVRVEIASGTLSATGFTSPTLYVNGAAGSTVAATTWQQLAVTSATAVSASNVLLGQSNTSYYGGDLSNVKFFSVQLSAAQIAELYANPEQVLPTGVSSGELVGWWPLFENANTGYCIDSSNVGKIGTLSGATITNTLISPNAQYGILGQNVKMWFDGVNDYCTISGIDLTGDFTIYSVFSDLILTENHLCGDISLSDTIRLDKLSNRVALRINSNTFFFTSAGINNSNIHNFALTRSGTTITCYVDNVNLGSATSADNFFFSEIGRGYVTWFFGGIIHNIAVFDTALTSAEITEIYNSGNDFDYTTNSGTYVSSGNLQGYWKNTGKNTNDWNDRSGNGLNCTVNGTPVELYFPNGITSGKDIRNTVLQRTNTGELILNSLSYALITDAATLDITTAITLEAWVKPFTVSTAQTIIGKNTAYALGLTSAGKPVFTKWTSAASTATATTTTALTVNTWYHIAVTYDGTNVKIYIDGAIDTTTAVSGAIDSTSTDVLMGALTTSTELFSGYIDSVKIYSSDLTAAQVAENYNAETAAHSNA